MWYNKYVGWRFKLLGRAPGNVDCWGLVIQVMREEKGLELPEYERDYEAANLREKLRKGSEVIRKEIIRGGYSEVTDTMHQPFDLVAIKTGRLPLHVGIVTRHGRMLHIDVGVDACIVDYLGVLSPYSNIIEGVYRHAELC